MKYLREKGLGTPKPGWGVGAELRPVRWGGQKEESSDYVAGRDSQVTF